MALYIYVKKLHISCHVNLIKLSSIVSQITHFQLAPHSPVIPPHPPGFHQLLPHVGLHDLQCLALSGCLAWRRMWSLFLWMETKYCGRYLWTLSLTASLEFIVFGFSDSHAPDEGLLDKLLDNNISQVLQKLLNFPWHWLVPVVTNFERADMLAMWKLCSKTPWHSQFLNSYFSYFCWGNFALCNPLVCSVATCL